MVLICVVWVIWLIEYLLIGICVFGDGDKIIYDIYLIWELAEG
jgi:hypothetical protein